MKVKMIVEGGNMKPGPAVSQQLGPMGINLGKVMSDVNEATKDFKGMKVPIELDVDAKTKDFTVEVFSPPVSELLKKELGIEKGSGEAGKNKCGNISIERVINIAKTKLPNLLAKDLKKGTKLVVGSCVSLGILIDNKEAKEIIEDIDSGKYDREIDSEITEVSDDKREKLDKFFAIRKAKQDKDQKAIEEAEAAAEAAKAEAAASSEAKPEEKKEEEKKEEKKK
tara:strand:- start:137 stop:811 length:675 start_codon:yes stop_codon:yes gene_type:complete